MKLVLTILLTLFMLIHANRIEDLAFDAYKAKDYKMALKLYRQEAKKDSLKSILMIGVFLEKGLGIKADKEKAIKIYKLVLKKVKNLKPTKYNFQNFDIAAIASERLYHLTNEKAYLKLANKLRVVKNKISKKASVNLNLSIKNYLERCPAAKIVKPQYQEGIDMIDCELFNKFPKRMAQFMKLKKDRAKVIREHKEAATYEINKKILKDIKPVLKYIEQQTIECYSNANFLSEIKACDYDYFVQTDPLLFTDEAYKMERLMAKSKNRDIELSKYQKDKVINNLIYKFSTQDYDEEAYRMVKLY